MKYRLADNEKIILTGHFKYDYLIFFAMSIIALFATILTREILNNFVKLQDKYLLYLFCCYLLLFFTYSYKKIKGQELVLTNQKIFILLKKRIIILYPKITKVDYKNTIFGTNLIIRVGIYQIKLYNLINYQEIINLIYQKI